MDTQPDIAQGFIDHTVKWALMLPVQIRREVIISARDQARLNRQAQRSEARDNHFSDPEIWDEIARRIEEEGHTPATQRHIAGWYAMPQGRLYYGELHDDSNVALAVSNVAGLIGGVFPLLLGSAAARWGLPSAMWLCVAAPVAILTGLPGSDPPKPSVV